ncbi:MAG: hypothetical protein KDC46_02405 [Thermoleophilia bacterium]|nr:hypothetical protein [Thermoleophilia bacterium]
MADEQTPQSDLIDDAIRQAERQLEEKLNALRMSVGDPAQTPASAPADDDVAVLRPTGTPASTRASEPAPAPQADATPEPTPPAPVPTTPAPARTEPQTRWAETGGDDVSFAPLDDSVPSAGVSDLYVPEDVAPYEDDEPASTDYDVFGDEPAADPQSAALRDSLRADVTDLTPVWDEDEPSTTTPAAPMPTTRRSTEQPAPQPRPVEPETRPEPVHSSWTDGGARTPRREPSQRLASLPSEDEMQFWAHTRTALRNLQQVTDGMPTQIVGGVSTEFARLLHEELGATDQALRNLSAEVTRTTQQDLPKLADGIQKSVEQAMASPNNGIRQLRDELPAQVDRAVRATHDNLREELDRTTASIHGAVQHDITQLEQSIATNVTRMAQGTTDAVGRVEHDVDVLGETVVRFERGVQSQFDAFEAQLRSAIEQVEQNLRDELVPPSQTIRKLDEELPSRFSRIERTVTEQLQDGQREVAAQLKATHQATTDQLQSTHRAVTEQLQSGQREQQQALTSLVEADRAALDRLQSLASTLDEDRARRAEDLDVVVDTVTTGWEALAGAMASLFEQAEENSRRLAGIENRLGQLRDVENAMEDTLDRFQRQMRELKPSPIVVTVSHDEAEVRNETRAGWSPESGS